MSYDWCVGVYGMNEEMVNNCKTVMESHCEFLYVTETFCIALALFKFKAQKCRETLLKLLKNVCALNELQILAEPPKTTSTPVALFFYQKALKETGSYKGQIPDWIIRQTSLEHTMAYDRPFELSVMVQWAYDNEIYEECDIAYGYAERANEDENARAFLKNNAQAKIVKDVATMVRHYKRHELRKMTMSRWIHKRCSEIESEDVVEDAWKQIHLFLRYQGIEWLKFIAVLRRFLKGEPKKSCIVFQDPQIQENLWLL